MIICSLLTSASRGHLKNYSHFLVSINIFAKCQEVAAADKETDFSIQAETC